MTFAGVAKTISAFIGVLLAYLFPTQIVSGLFTCLLVSWFFDAWTGIRAASHRKKDVCPKVFIVKFGDKLTRTVVYCALGWILGRIGADLAGVKTIVAEPMGAVLSALLCADVISILRNLALAKNNIKILDVLFTKLFVNIRDAAIATVDIPGDKNETVVE